MDDTPEESTVELSERYDAESDRSVSLLVVQLVAIASDRDPVDLPPLARSVDTDALDAVVDSTLVEGDEKSVRVSFEYGGYRIVIEPNGVVRLLSDNG